MDPTEDLSARVLLKHILSTEPPATPVTRSVTQRQSPSGSRRSTRLSSKNAGAQTPTEILRRSMRSKMHESITRKSLPATKRRTSSVVVRTANRPSTASMLFNDGDTPRHILMNILQTEPVKTPVVHDKGASEEIQPPSANTTLGRTRPSVELSGLDLPDLTVGNAASTVKRLTRKRPRRLLDVTAFEKRLKDGDDAVEETEELTHNQSSLSLTSSTSLSLKTPFVDVQTEKRGLQRRVFSRRTITVEEFGAAVVKRQMEGGVLEEELGEMDINEGFTLSLSNLSEPNVTTDIVNCNTALYDRGDATTSSIASTQDKPPVGTTSRLQRDMMEEELRNDKTVLRSITEEGDVCEPLLQRDEERTDQGRPEDSAATSEEVDGGAECEEGANTEKAQTEEEEEEGGGLDSQREEDVEAASQAEEDEEGSKTEEKHDEEDAAESQMEEADSLPQADVEAASEEEEEEEEEEAAPDSQTEGEIDEEGVDSRSQADIEAMSQTEEEEEVAESQNEDDCDGKREEEEEEEEEELQAFGQLEDVSEHISRRARRSEGSLIMTFTEEREDSGRSAAKSAGHSPLETRSHESSRPTDAENPDMTEPLNRPQADATAAENEETDADKENSYRPELISAEDAAPQEEEEEWEEDDEENDEFGGKTPPFVREKRNFFLPGPSASSSGYKNIQASDEAEASPAAKPKRARQRKAGSARKKESVLPKSYLMSVFKHFAKTKVSADVYPLLDYVVEVFFDRMVDDLETYAAHAKRKSIEVEDVELLLRRQGHVNDKVPVEVLIEKYLRMEQRKLLIPIATSGNVVIPKMRR